MRGIGDFFVKLVLNVVGLVLALLTVIYAVSIKQEVAAWFATVSLLSGILLVVLSVQEIRIILNLIYGQSLKSTIVETEHAEKILADASSATADSGVEYSLAKSKLDFKEGSESRQSDEPPDLPDDDDGATEEVPAKTFTAPIADLKPPQRKINSESYQFFEVVKKSKADHAFGHLEVIDDIYRKIKPYLSGERGLIISGSSQARGPYAPTLKQVLNGDKTMEQLICKNIYPDLDLLPDTEVNFIADRKAVESTLAGLWSDYYRVVILVEEWEEEFWRAVARNVNDKVSLGQNQEWLTVPAIKRKRPISYQNLSRFEIFNNRNTE
jgi:hypothetical protein